LSQQHWESVWEARSAEEVSWFQADPATSLRLIESVTEPGAAVIDIGSGATRLVEALLACGYRDLTVLDISASALSRARERLANDAAEVTWIVEDVTTFRPRRHFDLWHDRAVLHFLTEAADRRAYRRTVKRCIADGGHVVVATFGPDGPVSCSGLPVMRHDQRSLAETLGDDFEPIDYVEEEHRTPGGATQQFLYGLFRRRDRSER
jgi:SAM-dependent methyltransferase